MKRGSKANLLLCTVSVKLLLRNSFSVFIHLEVDGNTRGSRSCSQKCFELIQLLKETWHTYKRFMIVWGERNHRFTHAGKDLRSDNWAWIYENIYTLKQPIRETRNLLPSAQIRYPNTGSMWYFEMPQGIPRCWYGGYWCPTAPVTRDGPALCLFQTPKGISSGISPWQG